MPGWLKVLLIVLVTCFVLAIGVVVIAGVLIYRNKDAITARSKEMIEEGEAFGEKSDNQGCVDEAISRYKAAPGFSKAITTNVFISFCLKKSRPTDGFCDNVPRQTDFMNSAEWRSGQCRRVGLGRDSYCPNLFAPIQQYCERGARRSPENTNSNSQ